MKGQFLEEVVKYKAEEAEPSLKIKPPKKYKVILLNDDYTPMEFVVEVLMYFFRHSLAHAIDIMLQVHRSGKGICGIFTRDIAETKVVQVNNYSRDHEHPLLCVMEPED